MGFGFWGVKEQTPWVRPYENFDLDTPVKSNSPNNKKRLPEPEGACWKPSEERGGGYFP